MRPVTIILIITLLHVVALWIMKLIHVVRWP